MGRTIARAHADSDGGELPTAGNDALFHRFEEAEPLAGQGTY